VAAQCDLYRKVLEKARDREVVFRTLDVGATSCCRTWLPPRS
jgi:signal transduction protein with GAF and PtsI domain